MPNAHVNFADWVGMNKEGIDQMGKRVQKTQDELLGYANRGRNELKQAVQERAGSSAWDGDYTKLDEFGHYKDSTNAFNDYQADSQNNQGRQMQLYNQYEGQATGADAALLYGRGTQQAANNQKPQGWDNYLRGVEQIGGEATAKFNKQKAAQDAAMKAARDAADRAAADKAAADAAKAQSDLNTRYNTPVQTTYGGSGQDPNMIGSRLPQDAANLEKAKSDWAEKNPPPNEPTITAEGNNEVSYNLYKQAWDKYYKDLQKWGEDYANAGKGK